MQASTSRRRKSHSPEPRPTAQNAVASTENGKKKKKALFAMWSSIPASSPQASNTDETPVDRGRKNRSKHSAKSQSRPENASGHRQGTAQAKSSKRERSVSRDSPRRSKGVSPARSAAATLTEDEGPGQTGFTGPLAAAEFARLKAENEALKKQIHTMKKTIGKQTKSKKEQGQQMEKLKSKSKKSEENWFRSAPPHEDDMYDDDDPDYILFRHKSCPSCRASVRQRPVPLFILKAIASAVANEDDGFDAGDMWAALPGYGTESDEEAYEGSYIEPRWAPPTVYLNLDDGFGLWDDLDDETLSLLRRGATLGMIEMYQMQYSHEQGITAMLDGGENTVYLGWNINLHENDILGEVFMQHVESDIVERPDRWRVRHDHRTQTFEAWRLVPEEEVEEYDTTDTEAWIQSDDDED
ncbi:hypothetical protein GLOTRDRAFT_93105 [Gloeophyllum trabeum ATCC 11539]|uniref:DUF8191 domain-containing protein n=1 Tax=Gloeophyllum trabeum (strain ATCC 11539 / FP-39264 / Madison 617) TaxID=670483 RepID=S7QBL2_GLOTA|nr:uncharacterized protein GLOTRDRAFT_93105 [Gloeophyllum trabeum ATCC 11539]EPQ56748.1 hypothetical protein GLOTRDRAFT_93105 [Gloeophyllum trabeum ATCC 11539]